jgi:two-component system CheB/CheR fusion protein
VEVIPVRPADTLGRWFVVFFELLGPLQRDPGEPVKPPPAPSLVGALVARLGAHAQRQPSAGRDSEVGALREEQRALREQVRVMLEEHESAIEELKALEEETLSSNEEFQSTNEELETAKEELQSINEELSTANDELNFRNRELKIAHEVSAQARDYADAMLGNDGPAVSGPQQ